MGKLDVLCESSLASILTVVFLPLQNSWNNMKGTSKDAAQTQYVEHLKKVLGKNKEAKPLIDEVRSRRRSAVTSSLIPIYSSAQRRVSGSVPGLRL